MPQMQCVYIATKIRASYGVSETDKKTLKESVILLLVCVVAASYCYPSQARYASCVYVPPTRVLESFCTVYPKAKYSEARRSLKSYHS